MIQSGWSEVKAWPPGATPGKTGNTGNTRLQPSARLQIDEEDVNGKQ